MTVINNLLDVVSSEQFAIIASSNLLSKSWFVKLKQPKGTFIKFVGLLAKNPEALLHDADEELKLSFYQDLPRMLKPIAVEEEIINNKHLHKIVYKLIAKHKIAHKDFDDAHAIGLIAIRNSLWSYTKTEILFTTFAYTIIKNKLFEFKRVERTTKKEINISEVEDLTFFETISNNIDANSSSCVKVKNKIRQNQLLESIEQKFSINYFLNSACYDDFDRNVMKYFLENRKKWVELFVEKNINPKSGKPYSAFAIRKRFHKIIQRMKDIVKSEDIQQYQVAFAC